MVAGGWSECEGVMGGHEGEHRVRSNRRAKVARVWTLQQGHKGGSISPTSKIFAPTFSSTYKFSPPNFPQPPFYSQGGAGASALSIRAQLGHASQPMSTLCQLEPTVSQIGFVPAPHPAPATEGPLPSAPSALSMPSGCRSSALSSASLRLCGESQSPARLKVIHAPGGKA
jgi:hypothetical protein